MRRIVIAVLFLILLAGSFWAGSWFGQGETAKVRLPEMASSSVTADAASDTAAEPDLDESSLAPGTVRITPDKQQLIGVRTSVVENATISHFIRTVGTVAADEKRVYRITAGTDGWIRETYHNDTGTIVKKGERLASFYSPLFRTTQYNYLSVLGSSLGDRYDAGRRQVLAPSQLATLDIKTYVDALESLGMSEQQMKELADTRKVTDDIYIIAPATGFVIARDVSPGQQFVKGAEWYQLANLERVWVLADLYPNEAGDTKPGVTARVTLPDQNKAFQATVSEVLPQFDPDSRTLKVRLEVDNPDYFLRPDMFVDVEFPVTRPPALTVPVDAVLDSGLRKTVFVERGKGFFEPRQVETGWRHGNRVEITRGLAPGERIAVSGNFLIDSESRLELAAQGMYGTLSKDPVCGLDVSVNKAEKSGRKSTFRGATYYFSSEECKARFDENPDKYTKP